MLPPHHPCQLGRNEQAPAGLGVAAVEWGGQAGQPAGHPLLGMHKRTSWPGYDRPRQPFRNSVIHSDSGCSLNARPGLQLDQHNRFPCLALKASPAVGGGQRGEAQQRNKRGCPCCNHAPCQGGGGQRPRHLCRQGAGSMPLQLRSGGSAAKTAAAAAAAARSTHRPALAHRSTTVHVKQADEARGRTSARARKVAIALRLETGMFVAQLVARRDPDARAQGSESQRLAGLARAWHRPRPSL